MRPGLKLPKSVKTPSKLKFNPARFKMPKPSARLPKLPSMGNTVKAINELNNNHAAILRSSKGKLSAMARRKLTKNITKMIELYKVDPSMAIYKQIIAALERASLAGIGAQSISAIVRDLTPAIREVTRVVEKVVPRGSEAEKQNIAHSSNPNKVVI